MHIKYQRNKHRRLRSARKFDRSTSTTSSTRCANSCTRSVRVSLLGVWCTSFGSIFGVWRVRFVVFACSRFSCVVCWLASVQRKSLCLGRFSVSQTVVCCLLHSFVTSVRPALCAGDLATRNSCWFRVQSCVCTVRCRRACLWLVHVRHRHCNVNRQSQVVSSSSSAARACGLRIHR